MTDHSKRNAIVLDMLGTLLKYRSASDREQSVDLDLIARIRKAAEVLGINAVEVMITIGKAQRAGWTDVSREEAEAMLGALQNEKKLRGVAL